MALISIPEITQKQVSLEEYLDLVDNTGRSMVAGKVHISDKVAPILEKLQIKPACWFEATRVMSRHFCRVVGPEKKLNEFAVEAGKAWVHGLQTARRIFSRALRTVQAT